MTSVYRHEGCLPFIAVEDGLLKEALKDIENGEDLTVVEDAEDVILAG